MTRAEKVVQVLARWAIYLGGGVSLVLLIISLMVAETTPAWVFIAFISYYFVQGVLFSNPGMPFTILALALALGMIILLMGDLIRIGNIYGSLDGMWLHYFFIAGSILIWLAHSRKIGKRGD